MANNTNPFDERHFSVRLMRHLVVPTFVLDPKGTVIIWNKACERLTGISAERLIGTNEHWRAFYEEPRDCLADILIKGDISDVDALYNTHSNLEDDEFGLSAESWCIMPQLKQELYLAIDAGSIFNESGELIAVVETLRDITEQKLAQKALKELAHKDGLTGLSNRRAFNDRLEVDWSLAERSQSPIGLLFIDIDHFKPFNDIYGHQAGDDCLKIVANCIAEQSQRPSDFSARYGGEEFVVILPNCDLAGTIHLGEQICQAVFQLNYPHSGSSTEKCVTISIGASSLVPAKGQLLNSFIESADKALYRAKESGRNRVTASD